MRAGFLCLIFVAILSSPALASEVRVKSKHDKVKLEGAGLECLKIGPEETLRAGVIGPGTVRVTLRRTGDAKNIVVKLMRDGREISKLTIGGKLKDALEGDTELASAAADKAIDVPAGPHTLFVEVGPGKGAILVSFDEVRAGAVVAAKDEKKEPVAKIEPKVEAKVAKVEPKVEPKVAKVEPKATPGRLGEDEDAVEPKVAAVEPKPAGRLEDHDTTTGTRLEDKEPEPTPAVLAQGEPTAKTEPHVRFLVGPRLGIADQTQLGAVGPAVGLSLRWVVAGRSTPAGTRGLLIGLSADALRYSVNLKISGSAALPAFTNTLTVTSVPVLLDLTYSFGEPDGARLTPFLGIALGTALGSIKTERADGLSGTDSDSFATWAVGAHAGLEFPIGSNRLGLEGRWLWSKIGDTGLVHQVQVGGVLIQASWRFGL